MNYEDFLNKLETKDIKITLSNDTKRKTSLGLDNEALFQLPLIAMIILLLSKNARKAKVSEIGQLVGELLEDTMTGFKGSSQYLGWSSNLRIRTVTALNFLEAVDLVSINNRDTKISITKLGNKVISRALDYESDLAYNLALIERSYRNYRVDTRLDGELL